MKVTLVGPVYPFRGGIAHYTTLLYQALCSAGHDVLLVSFRRQYPARLFPGRSDRDPSNQVATVEEAHYWIDSLNPVTWYDTFRRIRRYRPAILALQWWTTFWMPVWLVLAILNRLWLRSTLVYICHNVLPHELRPWDRWLTRLTLGRGDRFVVSSAQQQSALWDLLPGAAVDVVPMPLFSLPAGAKREQAEARRQLGLPSDVPILLFFGHVREYKGLDILLDAVAGVQGKLADIRLVIAGEFWRDKVGYLQQMERLGIRDRIVIDDRYIPNEEVGTYFSAVDALVAPYRAVTGSAVMQLAASFDTPVITLGSLPSRELDRDPIPPDAQLAATIQRFFTLSPAGRKQEFGQPPQSWKRLVDVIVGDSRE